MCVCVSHSVWIYCMCALKYLYMLRTHVCIHVLMPAYVFTYVLSSLLCIRLHVFAHNSVISHSYSAFLMPKIPNITQIYAPYPPAWLDRRTAPEVDSTPPSSPLSLPPICNIQINPIWLVPPYSSVDGAASSRSFTKSQIRNVMIPNPKPEATSSAAWRYSLSLLCPGNWTPKRNWGFTITLNQRRQSWGWGHYNV